MRFKRLKKVKVKKGKNVKWLQRVMIVGFVVTLCWTLAPIRTVHAEDFYPDNVAELIDAINQANDEIAYPGWDKIYLTPGATYSVEVPYTYFYGQNGFPPITSEIEIIAENEPATIRRSPSAEEEFRFFYVAPGALLYFKQIILTGGRLPSGMASEGGAIYTRGNVNLVNSTIQNSIADRGGAIYNQDRLSIQASTIHNNTASFGGGIYSEGWHSGLYLDGHVLSNTAIEDGGGIYLSGGRGMHYRDSSVRGNRAQRGAGIMNVGGELMLALAFVVENTAIIDGGGIYNENGTEGEPGVLEVGGSEISGNQARSRGGGICNFGEVLIYWDSNINNNSVAGMNESYGGGIYNDGELDIRDTMIQENSVEGGHGMTGHPDGYDAFGGGISNYGNLYLTNVGLWLNTATGGEGADASIGAAGNGGVAWGGGIHNSGDMNTEETVTIRDNHAYMSQGGRGLLFGHDGQPDIGRGGGLYNSGRAELPKGLFLFNSAYYGGGAYNVAELWLTNTTISQNTAEGLAAKGGALYDKDGETHLNHVTIAFNHSLDRTGGVWAHPGTVYIQNSILAGNTDFYREPDCHSVSIISLGHNLFGDSKYCPVDESIGDLSLKGLGLDITDVLGTLQTYHPSGAWGNDTTMLHRVLPGSPAIDSADPSACPSEDQRFGARPIDGDGDTIPVCDMGAYEYDPTNP